MRSFPAPLPPMSLGSLPWIFFLLMNYLLSLPTRLYIACYWAFCCYGFDFSLLKAMCNFAAWQLRLGKLGWPISSEKFYCPPLLHYVPCLILVSQAFLWKPNCTGFFGSSWVPCECGHMSSSCAQWSEAGVEGDTLSGWLEEGLGARVWRKEGRNKSWPVKKGQESPR